MKDDIDIWVKRRLQQWVINSMERYDMADIDPEYAFSSVTALLMVTTLRLLAETDATPEELGYKVMKTLKEFRELDRHKSERTP